MGALPGRHHHRRAGPLSAGIRAQLYDPAAALLEQRGAAGARFRDCHGDIRLDAVCFTRRRLHLRLHRVQPPLSLLGRRRGRGLPGHGPGLPRPPRFLRAAGADLPPGGGRPAGAGAHRLLQVLPRRRAGQGGGVQAHPPEVRPTDRREARQAARAYFRLACRYAAASAAAGPDHHLRPGGHRQDGHRPRPRRALGAPVISSDVVRKELAGAGARRSAVSNPSSVASTRPLSPPARTTRCWSAGGRY